MMFIVMFEFIVREGSEKQFIKTWPRVSQGIYLLKGSMGSRLHRVKNNIFVDYAQWPNHLTWKKSSSIEMTPEYEGYKTSMLEALELKSTRTLYQMEVEFDYFQQRPFDFD